jgi:hypothetical protein
MRVSVETTGDHGIPVEAGLCGARASGSDHYTSCTLKLAELMQFRRKSRSGSLRDRANTPARQQSISELGLHPFWPCLCGLSDSICTLAVFHSTLLAKNKNKVSFDLGDIWTETNKE